MQTLLRNRTIMDYTLKNYTLEQMFELKKQGPNPLTEAIDYYLKENTFKISKGYINLYEIQEFPPYHFGGVERKTINRGALKDTFNIGKTLLYVEWNSSGQFFTLYFINPKLKVYKDKPSFIKAHINQFNHKSEINESSGHSINYDTIYKHVHYPKLEYVLTSNYFELNLDEWYNSSVYLIIYKTDELVGGRLKELFELFKNNIIYEDQEHLYSA